MARMNDAGVALLKKWEGCILHADDDANEQPVNSGTPIHRTLTIGYGHSRLVASLGLQNRRSAEIALWNTP